MKERIIIIGGGGHAKVIINILKKLQKFEIIGYVDLIDKNLILGIKYLGTDEVLEKWYKWGVRNVAIGIGQNGLNSKRFQIIKICEEIGFNIPNIISPTAIINQNIKLGKGNQILDGVIINSGTIISDYNIINTGAIIEHDVSIGNYCHIAPGVIIGGEVKIGNYTMVGLGAKVKPGIYITDNCMIGAGGLVIKALSEPGIYIGIPVKKKIDQ